MNRHLDQERSEFLQARVEASESRERLTAWARTEKELPVVDVEVKWVRFSTLNHRLKAEQARACRDRGNPRLFLDDPLGDAAQEAQFELLRATNDFDKLSEDLRDRGQQEPAVVTAEGVLINGNRRAAALREIDAPYIRCFVLPEDATMDEVRLLETELQVSVRFEEEYSWINRAMLVDELLGEYGEIDRVARIMRTPRKDIESDLQALLQVNQLVALSQDKYVHADFEPNESAFKELSAHIANKPEEQARPVRHTYFLGILAGCNYRDLRHLQRSDAMSFVLDEIDETQEAQEVVSALAELQQDQHKSEIDDLLEDALGPEEQGNAVEQLMNFLVTADADDDVQLKNGVRIGVDAVIQQANRVVTQAAHEAEAVAQEETMVQAPTKRIEEALAKVKRAASLIDGARALPDWDEAAFSYALSRLDEAVGELKAE